jgi:isopenicillin N synthase-like dioxygenase
MTSLPIIDLSAPDATSNIGAAARAIGFFYITGHGLSDAALAEIFAQSRRLFALSPAHLAPIALTGQTGNRGYVGMKGESLDPTRPADLKEAFNIGFEMPDGDPDTAAGRHFRAPNLWPGLPGFRDAVLGHFAACHAIGRRLHRAFAADLGLPPGWFEDKLDRPMATLRLLHYPPRPDRIEPGQLGAGEHTDYGCVTLLLTDDAGGLQVRRRDGTWIDAPHVPGAFVCNIGDCLMRWTSDIYVSTPHRVVNPAGRERYSVAFFLDPNPEAVVAPLPGLPPAYDPILAEDYLRERLTATYAGKARPA